MHTVRRALLALLALAVLTPAGASATDDPNAFTVSEAYIKTSNPTITLHADVMRPANLPADAPTPVILSIGPYFPHSQEARPVTTPVDGFAQWNYASDNRPQHRFDDLINEGRIFEKGYTLVYVDLPGFGGSSGCNDFGGPNEQLGAKEAVEWAAAQPWSTGKVGMWGKSYDAWTQVMALATKPAGLAATVIQSPIIDGYRTLYQNGVHYELGWYLTPYGYQSSEAMPPALADTPDYYANWAAGEIAACYALNIAEQTALIDKDDPAGFWDARDIVDEAVANSGDVAVLWSHGFLDANTKPDNFLDVYTRLEGPHRGFFGQFQHVRGNEDALVGRAPGTFMGQAMRWFDEYLKGHDGATADDNPVEVADSEGRWRAEAQWPPADAVTRTIPLLDGTYTDDDSNAGNGSYKNDAVFTFTQALGSERRIAGVPKLTFTATTSAPRAQLTVLLYDVDGNGKARYISRAATAIGALDSGPRTIELYPEDYRVRTGHRIGVLIAGDDTLWYLGPHSNQDVTVSDASLTLPILTEPRTTFLTTAVKTQAMTDPDLNLVPTKTVPLATIQANTVQADLG